jgi:hypothetical protein
MTKENKDLRNDLTLVVRLLDKGELEDLPAPTYKKLCSATRATLGWHERNYGARVRTAWVFVLLVGVAVFVLAVQVGLP